MAIDKRFQPFTLFLILSSFFPAAGAPVPLTATHPLFVIERSKNANKVHYEARLTGEGVLDVRKPVHAYWVNWEKDSTGKTCEELNLIEKQMAFGFSVAGRSRSRRAVEGPGRGRRTGAQRAQVDGNALCRRPSGPVGLERRRVRFQPRPSRPRPGAA